MIELIEWDDNTVTPQSIGKRIQLIRVAADIPLMNIAIDCKRADATIVNLEHGADSKISTICKVLDVLGYELAIREKH